MLNNYGSMGEKKDSIALFILNTVGSSCDDPKDKQCIVLKSWMDKNFDWMYSHIKANKNDPYWHHVYMPIIVKQILIKYIVIQLFL